MGVARVHFNLCTVSTRALAARSVHTQSQSCSKHVSLNLARLFGQLLARAMASPMKNRPSKCLGHLLDVLQSRYLIEFESAAIRVTWAILHTPTSRAMDVQGVIQRLHLASYATTIAGGDLHTQSV